jgi:microcompartment protein CcmL/EutN
MRGPSRVVAAALWSTTSASYEERRVSTLAALGMIECGSLSHGSVVVDAMLKTARVHLLLAQPVCPGKMLIVVEGGVADVESAVAVGLDRVGDFLEDALFIPRLHPAVGHALMAPVHLEAVEALGMIETRTVAAGIRAADAALKTAAVDLLSIRLGWGIGGKAISYVTGTVADAQAAVEAGVAAVRVPSLVIHHAVIAQPHPDYAAYLASGPGREEPPRGIAPPSTPGD